jgi:hypothetical protein
MAKFGLFESTGSKPAQEFEGDFMTQLGENVMIFKTIQGRADHQTGAIRLTPGQSVKEING